MAGGKARKGDRRQDASGRRPRAATAKTQPKHPRPSPGPSPAPVPPGRFVLGAVPGATPGKWIDTWHERMPRTPLELVLIAVTEQRRALAEGAVDAAIVRLPIDRDGLHVIPLYEEIPVVVCARDSHLTAADELDSGDLDGEVLIVPRDDVLGVRIPGTVPPAFDAPQDTGEAIATVAAGVGIVVVPMSLARAHHRKDVEYRPLRDGPRSGVALAWPVDRATPAIDAFVGIVRGRTANSSRG